MAINYPTSLDTLTNPVSTDTVAAVDHATQHANANDAIEALEAKVGVNSSAVTTSHDYKLSGVSTGDKAVSKTGTETLTNKTLTTPVINGLTPVQRVYTAGATWTKPSGLVYVIVEVQGAGGGSGSSGASANNASGGGGGGGYGKKKIATASLGATETVTIGTGGTAGTSGTAGGNGGTSSFGSHVSCTGGTGSSRGPNGNGDGGTSTGGDINLTGQPGGIPILQASGGKSGVGGNSIFGVGGQYSNGAANGGYGYGSGAGGAFQNGAETDGQSGKGGIIVLTEYFI